MDHVAILAKKRKLLQKILSGEKTIESRWYRFKKTPYNSIVVGDTVYFKDSGEPVSVKARVADVLFFAELNKEIFDDIISKYGPKIGIDSSYWEHIQDKKLCTLIFLKDIEQITPFNIDKTGFGMMAAWLSVDSIDKIKKL